MVPSSLHLLISAIWCVIPLLDRLYTTDCCKIGIWGNPEQVANARAELESFEKSLRSEHLERRKNLGSWAKVSALDGRKEHREERKAQVDEVVERHLKMALSADFDFEVSSHNAKLKVSGLTIRKYWLLWPSQDLDFEQINTVSIEELKRNYWCVIDYNPDTSFVRIMANKERELLQVVQRMVNLVKELVAKLNQVIKANFLQPPSTSAYRGSVEFEKNESTLAIPILQGKPLPKYGLDDWQQFVQDEERSNRKQAGNALEKCVKNQRLSRKHVRMRLSLGQLAFKRYRLSSEGGNRYNYDDFCTMVANDRTAVELQGLPVGPETDSMVDKCANYALFFEPTEVYVVHFDFKEPTQASILRLECEFRPTQNHREVEVGQQRWLEFQPGAESNLLELNMLDFEKLDWQMSITAASFPDNKQTGKQLKLFQESVVFKPTAEGIKAKPNRRAFYAAGNRGLTCVTELTTIRYRVRDTEGVFELTRKEAYHQAQDRMETHPSQSTMSASYYYPEWDNLLAEYAYIEPGGQVSWQPLLSTFFPDNMGVAKPKGFKRFMEEVKELQQALSKDTTDSDEAKGKAPLRDLPNGFLSTNN